MDNHQPHVPRIDDTIEDGKLHERCEQVAIPDFDWFNEPIVAVIDGLLHIDAAPDAKTGRRRAR